MLGAGDVLCVGSVQCLQHLDAEAGAVTEEHGEWGMWAWAGSVVLACGCALHRLGVSCCVIPELGDDIGFILQEP